MPEILTPQALLQWAEAKRRELKKFQFTVEICTDTGCRASGSRAVAHALRAEVERRGLHDKVKIRQTGCHGFCQQGPLMVIEPGNIFYGKVTPQDVPEIVSETFLNNTVVERLCYLEPESGKRIVKEGLIPFYRAQDRTILGQNREVDPSDISEYIANGGYSALVKTLTSMKPNDVIAVIKESGLRGRGGGGYPTARKWQQCRAASGDQKYVICNADEGDPGAYMDRSVLEGNPHLVLEGMMIGAYAIGARQGYIYVRNEYPLAVRHARKAIDDARESGLLGENILGTGFSFDVKVMRGAGAFVCGESTALMASVEGKVGEPRPKDVHTVEKGLYGRPTNLNNVETWANVPGIINKGAQWFAARGTAKSKGTKIFALTGMVKNTGLVEVPMGTPLRTIVFDIGGGAVDGKAVKAVQTGGPSGGCLPVEKFDLPVDFEALTEAGSMVGSGGMVVMDESTCMVDVARYFLAFLVDESCGKCVPCRIGIDRMLEIVTDITEGRGTMKQLDLLEEVAETVQIASLCALGKTAPNPVLSTLHYFRSEYEAHIKEKRCPAGVCRALISFSIDPERCTGCGACLRACPHDAISGRKKEPHTIDQDLCQKCGICRDECTFDAVIVE
jgi:NADH:ubiquinone oxidoreductase subunit F (NADH-binding)/(2Fe-2S) ferredoxin/NAD-dependent dihydropyrimidine dehydrogenase PreA subunit